MKIRSYPAYAGLTSLGRAVANESCAARPPACSAGWGTAASPISTCAWTAGTDSYKLLDFNPRLGAQFRLFRDWAGVDVVTAAYLDLTGQQFADREQVPRRFLVENYDPLGALGYWQASELGPVSWLRSLYERGGDHLVQPGTTCSPSA